MDTVSRIVQRICVRYGWNCTGTPLIAYIWYSAFGTLWWLEIAQSALHVDSDDYHSPLSDTYEHDWRKKYAANTVTYMYSFAFSCSTGHLSICLGRRLRVIGGPRVFFCKHYIKNGILVETLALSCAPSLRVRAATRARQWPHGSRHTPLCPRYGGTSICMWHPVYVLYAACRHRVYVCGIEYLPDMYATTYIYSVHILTYIYSHTYTDITKWQTWQQSNCGHVEFCIIFEKQTSAL